MGPTRIRARAARAANKDPRGRYAPPSDYDMTSGGGDDETTHSIPSALKSSSATAQARDMAAWRLNKQDKRTIKHNLLLSKVHDSGVQKSRKPLKRRRPGKKLVTGMEDLADALSEMQEDDGEGVGEDEWEGISDEDGDADMAQTGAATSAAKRRRRRKAVASATSGKMVMTSLKHRPGAMKRKAALEGREKERFQKNLAQMVGNGTKGMASNGSGASSDPQAANVSHAEKWAALRNFIGSTLEQNKAFVTH